MYICNEETLDAKPPSTHDRRIAQLPGMGRAQRYLAN